MHRQSRKSVLLGALFAATFVNVSWAGPTVTVGEQFQRGDHVPMSSIEHAAWDALLRKYVDRQGNVAYARWQETKSDRAQLAGYLSTLSAARLESGIDRQVQLAFWMNAYNALTVYGILREYPTSSIRNHTPRFFGYHIWNDLQLIVGNRSFSLRNIEHDVLRKLSDPRIHFGIVCASHSCPRLRNEAYAPQRVIEQLEANAREFFADRGNFRHRADRQQFQLSAILKWFADDFGETRAARLRAIAPYLPSQEARAAARANSVSVSYLEYDWSLNDQSATRSVRR